MPVKLTEKDLHEVIERRSTGKTSFEEFLQDLANIGVNQYNINVATGEATYIGEDSEVKTDPQVKFVITDQLNRNQAIEAIANMTLPFLDLLRELANAGVATYNVHLIERKATYIASNGEQVVEPLRL
jgi:uncharacterized protein YbcV (DUF1398 family)